MKTLALALGLLMQPLAITIYTQHKATLEVGFTSLGDYVNSDKRKAGERFVVHSVTIPGDISYNKYGKTYFFQPVENGGNANDFFVSRSLAIQARAHLKTGEVSWRVTCTLIEFYTDVAIDLYRSPFATKIEAVDERGKIVWTAAGPEPTRLRYPQ